MGGAGEFERNSGDWRDAITQSQITVYVSIRLSHVLSGHQSHPSHFPLQFAVFLSADDAQRTVLIVRDVDELPICTRRTTDLPTSVLNRSILFTIQRSTAISASYRSQTHALYSRGLCEDELLFIVRTVLSSKQQSYSCEFFIIAIRRDFGPALYSEDLTRPLGSVSNGLVRSLWDRELLQ